MTNVKKTPPKLPGKEYYFDCFENNQQLLGKKKGHLPAMGWNSWNAFGSGNTALLTKAMADQMVELGLGELGYKYIVLDDGCYKSERVDGKLSNESRKFPDGFKELSDYIHARGLKFGMYNDIGTNLCAGAAVGTYGHEAADAESYISWGVDFLKVDNCYYLWDNATFSAQENARYVYTPKIKGIRIVGEGCEQSFSAVSDGRLTGEGCCITDDCVMNIGTFDGTNVGTTPVVIRSGELEFAVNVEHSGIYEVYVTYASGAEVGIGEWLQLAVGSELVYDDFLPETEGTDVFAESEAIRIELTAGVNRIRIMNHRRQENTLNSYATLLEGLNKADPEHDVIFSICEWGKTQPQNWGYKVGDSWRILNDITFRVGADGDSGHGSWVEDYTTSVTSQYNKAVIMDEFAGLDKGWNDPDMMMIGMDGMTETMSRTHMTMWSMMNAPLMLGMDLRRVTKGDAIWNIIANRDIVALNQDPLGIPAKRVYCSLAKENPETEYIRDIQRVDILAKPLADGGVAISFINVSDSQPAENVSISLEIIFEKLGNKLVNGNALKDAGKYKVTDLWSKAEWIQSEDVFVAKYLKPCDNLTIKVVIE